MPLRITETFYSLQGESSRAGLPTFFIRLTGCPLRCGYCDTAYAFQGGNVMELAALVQRAQDSGARYVCVTGGEPLAQPDCLPLLSALCDAGFDVSLETSGALPIDAVDARVVRVMDIKTPGSGEVERNHWPNLEHLSAHDQVKLVLCDRADYDWAVALLRQHALAGRVQEVLFSPSAGQLDGAQLAEWILADGLPVRLQLQLHKLLWGNRTGV